MVFEQCDIGNISIQVVYNKKGLFGNKRVIQDVNKAAFNISNGKWKYEICEEYYSSLGGLVVREIRIAKATMWCFVEMQFESMGVYEMR